MDKKQLVQEYLTNNKHMQLATVNDGKPWICTVYFVSDDNFNLYWTSGRERQHSKEIVSNPKSAVTVVHDAERKQALQMVGDAAEVNDYDLERVHQLYQSKFGKKEYDLAEIKAHKTTGRAYWVFRPAAISLWDEVNFPESPKQHYQL